MKLSPPRSARGPLSALPLPFCTALALTLALTLAGCGGSVTEGTGGGGNGGNGGGNGGGTTTSATTSSASTSTSDTPSTTSATSENACIAAGGTCVALVPDACENGTWLDATQYPCGTGDGVGCCLIAVCTPGKDQTCNANLSMSSFAGTCNADGTCTCNAGFTKNAEGKCG